MTDITQLPSFADIRELRTAADMAGLSQEFAALVYDHQKLQAGNARLRAELAISHPPLPVKMVQCGVYCATAKGLIDDADRLRAALREVLDEDNGMQVMGTAWHERARAALGDQT